MSSIRLGTAIAGCAVTALASLGSLAGCAVTSDKTPTDARVSRTPEPKPSTPTVTVTETATATPTQTPVVQPESVLLTAAGFPRFNDSSAWTEQGTGPAEATAFGLCQKFDLGSIGAVSVLERTFATGGDSAGQQVADFADSQTAVRASKVLASWHGDCAGRVTGRRITVRPITDVAVPRGKGWHYLVSYTRQGQGHFHAFGLVLDGTRLVLLRMDHAGQDHNYDPGKDPMELAVKAAAAKLGG